MHYLPVEDGLKMRHSLGAFQFSLHFTSNIDEQSLVDGQNHECTTIHLFHRTFCVLSTSMQIYRDLTAARIWIAYNQGQTNRFVWSAVIRARGFFCCQPVCLWKFIDWKYTNKKKMQINLWCKRECKVLHFGPSVNSNTRGRCIALKCSYKFPDYLIQFV